LAIGHVFNRWLGKSRRRIRVVTPHIWVFY
jgi:hypothetical protein